MARRDVAYGFFWTAYSGVRYLNTQPSKRMAIESRRSFACEWQNPGPIFRITPPKPKRGRK